MNEALGFPCLGGVGNILQAFDDGPTRTLAEEMLRAIDTGRGLKSRTPITEEETRLLLAMWTLVRIARGEDSCSDRGSQLGRIFTGAMRSHKLFITLLGTSIEDLRISAKWTPRVEIAPTEILDFDALEDTSHTDRLPTLVILGAAVLGTDSERAQVKVPYLAFEFEGSPELWRNLRHKLRHPQTATLS